MATIRAYTTLEQSKKLAEILPRESADMRYGYIAPYDYSDRMFDGGYDEIPYYRDFLKKNPDFSENEYDSEFPCWSLTALLEVLDDEITKDNEETLKLHIEKEECEYYLYYENLDTNIFELETEMYDDLVDACYELILKLNELKML